MSGQGGKQQRPAQRYRICGTPSRLGCLTCKIRRVKCGEEKPFCKRCTSTGRKCDGYGPAPPPKITAVSVSGSGSSLNPQINTRSRPLLRTPSASGPSRPKDSLEIELFDYFTRNTLQSLSQHFWPAFWQYRVLQASSTEPSIHHAVIAIAAVHRDLVLKTAGQSDTNLQPFAFKQYTKAISHLHRLMSSGAQQQLDVTLISCILFICFDFLVGNHSSAIIHLKAGLKILEGLQAPNPKTIHKWKAEFAPLLLTLGVETAAFTSPHSPEATVLWASLTTIALPNQAPAISSVEEARHKLDILSAQIMAAGRANLDLELHLQELRLWGDALNAFTSRHPANAQRIHRPAVLLRIYALGIAGFISPPQLARDRHNEMLSLCQKFIATKTVSSNAITFSITQDIIQPLFALALRTSDAFLQAKAVELIRSSPGREGAFASEDSVRILESLKGRGEDLPIFSGMGMEDSERSQRVWQEVKIGLQGGTEWVNEDSPVGEDEIEVGRFEGLEVEMVMGGDFGGTLASGSGSASGGVDFGGYSPWGP